MKENIMVCVSNMANADSLVRRGHELSEAFGGKCFALFVKDKDDDDLDYNWLEKKEALELITKKHQAILLIEPAKGRKISTVIADVGTREKVKQIVLGQPARTRLDIIIHGSIINGLFAKLDGVDLHIVEVSKEVTPDEEQYEKGKKAYLVKTKEGYGLLFPTQTSFEFDMEGLFFRSQATEFCNGLFKVVGENQITIYRVHNGQVDPDSASIIKK